jgi:diguanylate cyclase (GGDEF)-like protein
MKKSADRWSYFLIFFSYLVLSFCLLAAPSFALFLFPLFGALIVAVAWLVGPSLSALLVLMTCLVCLGLWPQWPSGEQAFLAFGILQLWLLWFFLRSVDRRSFQKRYEREVIRYKLEKKLAELDKDIEFYRKHAEERKAKSSRRNLLAACARELGGHLDANEIPSRLLDWTYKSFPDAHCLLAGLDENDPVDAWLLQRRQSLLCEDFLSDRRFSSARVEPGTRSLMAAPLWVENRLFGGLRVESPVARRFGRDDLRILDALGALASLAMDNAVLYHRVEQLAVRDGLTQLLTHRAFEERLNEELLRAGRYHYPASLVMIDVDHFKKVNDTHGHQAGDDVLRAVSRVLAEQARPVDVAARYGGEEFCLLLVETPHREAVEKADRVREEIGRLRFQANGRIFSVTASLGVATYPEDATLPPQLVRAADQRLYQAKSGGRNRVVGAVEIT